MTVYQATYTGPDGKAISFGTWPLKIAEVEGHYAPEFDLTSGSRAGDDGSVFFNAKVMDREITITAGNAAAFDVTSIQASRRSVLSACNPKANDALGDGVLVLTEGAVSRRFKAAVSSLSMGRITQASPGNNFAVSFRCSDPFAYDANTSTLNLSTGAQSGSATNAGEIKTFPVVTITGAAVNPKIMNTTTGEYVRLIKTMVGGDSLVIDMATGSVKINDVSAIQYLDILSAFWGIKEGANTVTYSDNGANTASSAVVWRNRFLGF